MMFNDPAVKAVYNRYSARLATDAARMRERGAQGLAMRDEFLLPVGPEVGKVLHGLITARAPKRILELGTSYGYSTLFLADAAKQVGAQVVTMELADYKQAYAREQLDAAGLVDCVDFRCGDALALLAADPGPWDFVLLDIWKELYLPCFEALYPGLSDEGMIAADNMIEPVSARTNVREFRKAVQGKPDLQTTLLPIGNGIELSVRWSASNPKL